MKECNGEMGLKARSVGRLSIKIKRKRIDKDRLRLGQWAFQRTWIKDPEKVDSQQLVNDEIEVRDGCLYDSLRFIFCLNQFSE